MQVDDRERLRHMRLAARAAISFCGQMTVEQLANDDLVLSAVVKKLEIIGEAAFTSDPQSLNQIAGVPWPKVIGMRHILVHAYFMVDVPTVWEAVHHHLPALLSALDQHLGTEA